MAQLSSRQRGILADKLPDLANLTGGIVAFGQLVGQQPLSMRLFIVGAVVWAAFMIAATWIAGGTE